MSAARPRPVAPHLAALTGLRFFAAAWVLVYHAMPQHGVPAPIAAFASMGNLGVGLFFVLSGFILAHVYGDAAVEGTLARGAFWRARFARVYPAYFAALLFAIPFSIWLLRSTADAPRGGTLAAVAISTATMLQAWIPGWGLWWNTPGWSLSAEAFFYFAFPFIAPWLLRRRRGAALLIAIGCVGATVLASTLVTPDAMQSTNALRHALARFATAWNPLIRLPEFVLGVCTARIARLAPLSPRAGTWLSILAAAALVVTAVIAAPVKTGLLPVAAIGACSAVLIAGLAAVPASWLGSPLAMRLGNASYSLYLFHAVWHGYFLAIANRVVSREWATTFGAFAVYTITAIALALLVHDRIELPARRWLRRDAALTEAQRW